MGQHFLLIHFAVYHYFCGFVYNDKDANIYIKIEYLQTLMLLLINIFI